MRMKAAVRIVDRSIDAGLDRTHSLVKEIFEQLMTLRNNDGGWSNEDITGKNHEKTDPAFTKEILNTLNSYGFTHEE